MSKYLDMDGLSYLWSQFKAKLNNKVDKIEGKGLSSNDYTTTEKTKLSGIAAGANKYVHPNGISEGTYLGLTVNSTGHITSQKVLTTLNEYGITDAAAKSHTHDSADITSLDASKLTGTIDIARIPQGALERCVVVADDTARFALTTTTIQKGDTVKVTSTGFIYFVVDDTKLSSENGYMIYTASAATSVPWSGITDKPEAYTPASHTHIKSEITDFPTIPDAIKNPKVFSLVVNGTQIDYDGSAEKTVTIDENSLGITSITDTEIDTILVQ